MTERDQAELLVMTICRLLGKEVKPSDVNDTYEECLKEFKDYRDSSL